MYNSSASVGKSELYTSKETAFHWFKNLKAFDVTDKNKSYAQALLCNLHQKISEFGENSRVPIKNSRLQTNVSDTGNDRSEKKQQYTYQQVKPQIAQKRQMPVTNCQNYKNYQEIGKNGSVAGATETMNPLQLTNRFQPLLQISTDDACSTQPMLTDQAKNILVGKKNENGSLAEVSHNTSNIIPTHKQLVSNGCSKNFDINRGSRHATALPHKLNDKSVQQADEPFRRDSIQSCNTIGTLFHTDSYGTNTDSLSMHKLIVDHTRTENLEPQYQEMTLEPSTDLESTALYDHMFDQSESKQSKVFGFIPKSPLKLYAGPQVTWNEIPDIFQAHTLVKASNLPNYMGCRIPVTSGLNISKWRHYLAGYWDKQLYDLLEYGFPLDFDRKCPLNSVEENHTSANDNASHISKFLEEELQYQAILGPFDNKPIDMHISPLLVRDKQNSSAKRTIMDLSWPKGASVNNGVAKDVYLSTHYELKFPSVDLITNSLRNLGPSAQMFKIDISRAFHHIKVDPGDIDLLGVKFGNQYFLDRSLAFGFCHGSQIFQRCTDAIRYIMAAHGYPLLFNYIDDLIYTGLPSQMDDSFNFLKNLLVELGLDISPKKLVPPSTSVTCLGILINSIQKTISIPPEKLAEITQLCIQWSTKTYSGKRDLQSLLGSLLYVSKCVKHSRFFLNRMLKLLRDNHDKTKILITPEFQKDLAWFNSFLSHYNGVTYYEQTNCQFEVQLDACLTGLGGRYESMVYALPIPKDLMNYNIAHLEILNIVVALKVWAQHWANRRIKIHCDNMAVVEVLRNGRARDNVLALMARNIWLICAMFNIHIVVLHIPGKNNVLADLLSRWQFSSENHYALQRLLPTPIWVPTHLDLTLLNYSI